MERWTVKLVREAMSPESLGSFGSVRGPDDVAKIARHLLQDEAVEVMLAFFLNVRNVIVGWQEVTRGLVDCSLVHPREVFKAAILANASAVIVVHNHPSGDATPSVEDRRVTESLKNAGDILGIRLLDHVVVTANDWEIVRT
jgi:DNA repair protein RadC